MKNVMKFLSYVAVAAMAAILTMVLCGWGAQEQSKLDTLGDLLEEQFIGEADRKAMDDAAAQAMVNALGDRWSHYMSAEDYASYKEQMNNAYVGIGITIQVREDNAGFDVVQVTKGGPAEAAGVLAGDTVIAVEGQPVAELGLDNAKNMIRGEEGTQVNITVRRGDQELEMGIIRKAIQTEVATWEMLEENIGLIRIVNFDKRCKDESVAAIETLLEQGAQALIFDVRFNPGGYKTELVDLLNYLLPEGPLFRSEDYTGAQNVDQSDAKCLDIPMAVLVNADSYSAAEFFAAALSEYDAAIVVGEPTTGKGYFQVTYELGDGSAVAVSVGKYSTPNGVSLAEVGGIMPDYVVEVDETIAAAIYAGTLDPSEDPQIQAAIGALQAE